MTGRHVFALAVLFVGAAACGTQGAGDGGGLPADRTFLSTAVTEQDKPRPLVDGTRIELRFTGEEVRARAGCNQLAGRAEVTGGRLVVEGLSQTEMGCDAPRHAQDEWLSRFLRDKPTWQLTGDELVLGHDGVTIRLTDRATLAPDRPLVGPQWRVDTVVTGDVAGSVPADSEATLTFATDGTVTGSTGCNSLTGPAVVDGSTIRFGPIVTTKRACLDDRQRLETAVLAALAGPATFRVESDRLTLTGPNGAGLVLTARQ